MEHFIPIIGILAVFGLPAGLIALFMRQRHQEKMRLLDTHASGGRLAQLESAAADLEARMRTLESIVTSGDHDLEARLRRLSTSVDGGANRPRLSGE